MQSYAPAGAILALATAVQLVLASRWGLLADEAYYAYWSEHLALGYYDQPPLIAWMVALGRTLGGHHEVALRAPAILAGVVGSLALYTQQRRPLWLIWWIAVPPLCWLTFFATPDAPLLAFWSIGLAGAIAGGRGWWLAGIAGALATSSKYSGLAMFPLALLGTRDRSRDVAIGAALHGLLLVPHLVWLAQHDFVSVRFQLGEGLLHPHAPGLLGPPLVVLQQVGVLTPLLAIAVVWAWFVPTTDRATRVGWWTSAPLVVFFLLASLGGPPEAHWLAPAWIGSGLLLARATGPLDRLVWVGAGTGILASVALIAHVEIGLIRIPDDPANRVREGRELAQQVGAWALPEGVGLREPGVERAIPVFTERYQEASLLRWYGGFAASAHPDCGRPNAFQERPEGSFLFVRPPTTHPPTCVATGTRRALVGQDLQGRIVGRWDLFESAE